MKKLKLSLSLCMMCLSVSFLFFGIYGVYATQSVAYTLSGTITYTATASPSLELKDSGTYWYTELGTLYDKTTPIRWRVVSLDGTSKYTYDASKEPEIGTGTVFLQETYLGSKLAFDSDGVQNYYNSDIRTTINTLTTWNIQESDISSLIAKRNITSIAYGSDTSRTAYSGTTSDYFWLMSREEAESTYFTSDTERIWTPNNNGTSPVSWWLRSPDSNYASRVYFVYAAVGDFRSNYAISSKFYAVRAAFQLA